MTNAMLKAALRTASYGLAVFPCQPRGKAPCGHLAPRGVLNATRDHATIRAWWRMEPEANLGIAMGAVSAGHWALDVDVDHGGEESLHELEAEHGELPRTAVSLTGGGGRHLLFRARHNPIIRNRVGLRPGLDIRGDGGFIIAPPSMNPSGRRYRWAADNPTVAAEAPGWLMDMVLGLGRLEEPLVPTRPIQVPGRYAAAALRRACEAVAGAAPGTRNSTLNTEAFGMGQLVAAGLLSEEDAVMHLAEAAFMCGLGSDEVTTTIASGLRAGLRSPRDMEETEDAD